MENPKYVIFDGMDGSGKGTQIELLKEKFPDTVFTYEPGGTPFADEIRKIVRDDPRAKESTPLNNFLLFWAAREELLHNLVVPSLQAGKHVFSDRGDSSTFAYQIYGETNYDLITPFSEMRKLVFEKPGRRLPDLYVIFYLPAKVARSRVMAAGGSKRSHFDTRPLDYYERVHSGFENFRNYGNSCVFINADRLPEAIHEVVLDTLAEQNILPK